MKKFTLMAICLLAVLSMSAQTYTVISRSNDTIKMHPNALGAAASSLKSIIPGSNAKEHPYRLIKKIDQGKESLIFIDDFVMIIDKIFIAYETDMITPGKWSTIIVSYEDLYKAVVRENAIYLKGEILGMQVEMFQRPSLYDDMVKIDGIEFPLPLKLAVYESELAKKAEKAKEKESQQREKELSRTEEEKRLREIAENISSEIQNVQEKANTFYLAWLYKRKKLNYIDEDFAKMYSFDDIRAIANGYSLNELKENSSGFDKKLEKFSL